MPSRLTPAASLALICLLALGLGACGRRGALEPPSGAPAASAPGTTPTTLATRPGARVATSPDEENEAIASSAFASPQPNPVRRTRGYTVPNEPFFLDPLL